MITECTINNFLITEEIGSGAYGLVYKAVDSRDGKDGVSPKVIPNVKEYAIKATMKKLSKAERLNLGIMYGRSPSFQAMILEYFRQNNHMLALPEVDLDSIRRLTEEELAKIPHYKEIALHLKVHDHKNIVTIYKVLESPIATFIVMDYYKLDLFTSIVDLRHFENNGLLIKKVFLQICSAIDYCHKKKVFHCDIKPENMLLDSNDNVHLCDFGLATTAPFLTPNVCVGSSYYMAPERISYSEDSNVTADIDNSEDQDTVTAERIEHISSDMNYEQKKMEERMSTGNVRREFSHPRRSSSTASSTSDLNTKESHDFVSFSTANADIWSLGIILINLSCVRNPWLKAHQTEDTTFYYYVRDHNVLLKILPISDEFFVLLKRILKVDPMKRIHLPLLMQEIKNIRSFTKTGTLSEVPILTDEMYDEYTRFFDDQHASNLGLKVLDKPKLHNRASSSYLDGANESTTKKILLGPLDTNNTALGSTVKPLTNDNNDNNSNENNNTSNNINNSPKNNNSNDDDNDESMTAERSPFDETNLHNGNKNLYEFQERLKYLKMDLSSLH